MGWLTTTRHPLYRLSMIIDKRLEEAGVPAGSPIAFRLEPGSGVLTYLQLVRQVEQALRLGYLAEGGRLARMLPGPVSAVTA